MPGGVDVHCVCPVPVLFSWVHRAPARLSGTEHIDKISAESFKNQAHLDVIVSEAQEIVNNAPAGSSSGPGN
jgi:phosphoglucomutase